MDIQTIGVLCALGVALVGSAWRLSVRLGGIERTLVEIRADGRGVERRLDQLEQRATLREALRDRIVALETRCAARHGGEE